MTLAETKAAKISAMPFTISANVVGSGGGGFVGWLTINILISQRTVVVDSASERRYGVAATRCGSAIITASATYRLPAKRFSGRLCDSEGL